MQPWYGVILWSLYFLLNFLVVHSTTRLHCDCVCRNVLISSNNDFELFGKGRHERFSQSLGVFNDKDRKRFLLPMPSLGWHLAVLSFNATDGREFKFIFDGKPERPLVRPRTAPSYLEATYKALLHKPRTIDYPRPITSYMKLKSKPTASSRPDTRIVSVSTRPRWRW